jgi:hypothetical protein
MKVNKATIDLAYPDRDGQTRPYRTEHAEVVGHKPMTDEERTAFEAKQTEAAAVPDDRDVDGNIDHRPGSRILKKHAAEGETYERGKIKRHGFTIANGGNGSYEIHDPSGNRHFGGFLNPSYNSLSGTRGMVDKMKEDRDILGRDSKLLGESDERLKQFAAGYNEVSAKDATDLLAARKRKADTAAMPSIPTKANLAPRRRLAEHLATPEGKQEAREMIAELTKGDYAADSARADAVKSIARKLGISDEQMAGLESWQDDFNWSRISRMKDPAKIEAALGDLVDGGDTPDTPEAPTPTPKHVKGQPFTDGHLDEGEAISAGGNIRRGDYAIASTEDGYRVIEQFDSHRAMVNKFKTLAAARKKVDTMQAQRGPAAVEKSILAEFPDLRLMPEGQLALVANGNGNKADAARRLLAARKDA